MSATSGADAAAGLSTPQAREGQARLSPDAIVTRALALADAEGLDAVTIRRLAQDHHVTPMALYRHFRDKDELIDAMAERLLADIRLPEPDAASWHEQMRTVLAAFVAALRPHPNVAALTVTRILTSPPGLVLAERVLELLGAAGFSSEQAAEIGTYALCSLATLVTVEPGVGRCADQEDREDAIRAKKASLTALSPRRYPAVVAAADALTSCASERAYYHLGIDLVVTGMQGVRPTG
ncbi:MAG: TetR/AcrR family transcriptional regulator C-terminal domain-containing protein [Candidatus Dormibacteria bacterium]